MHPSSQTPSPTENKPSKNDSPQKQPPNQRELVEQAISATVMEIIQLRRTLWLAIQQAGGSVVIDEAACHPLWRLKCIRLENGKAELQASQLPEPSSHQISDLMNKLEGSRTPIEDAIDGTDLAEYPPAYLHMMLQSRIVLREDGYWVDATLHSMVNQPPTEKN